MTIAAKEPREFEPEDYSALESEMLALAEAELRDAYKITQKAERYAAVDAVKAKVMDALVPADGEAKFDPEKVKAVFKEVQAKIVRWNILDTGRRIDGYEWVPGRITNHVPSPLEGPARDAAVAQWNALRDCTGLAA